MKGSCPAPTRTGIFILWVLIFCLADGSVAQHSTVADETDGNLLSYRDKDGSLVKVRNSQDWEKKRQQILKGMQAAMGKMPEIPGSAPDFRIKDTITRESYNLYHIYLEAEPNDTLPAYLYIPHKAGKKHPRPAMLVLHGTGEPGKRLVDGESPRANRAHARELAERGYVVIAPDYPGMGELIDYDFAADRYQSGTMKAIVNHIRCVDLLQTIPAADTGRIGVIGHSLGGHNALFVAAFDTRLKVIVSSCGWTLMDYYDISQSATKHYGGRLGPWAQDLYMPLLRDRYELDSTKIPFDFDEVIATLAPRHFFSNSPLNDTNFDLQGVKQGIKNASAVYRLFDAEDHLQVRHPDAGHDFPPEVRLEAYRYIDSVLDHTPAITDLNRR